jgi:hypothetical protein
MNYLKAFDDDRIPKKYQLEKNQKLSPSLTFFASFLVQSSVITLESCARLAHKLPQNRVIKL